MTSTQQDINLGLQPWKDYILTEYVGKGKIGRVYRAVNKFDDQDVLACKIIKEKKLRSGWEKELEKLSKLRGVDGVVPYFHHTEGFDKKDENVVFIFYQFIDGWNLNDYVQENGKRA